MDVKLIKSENGKQVFRIKGLDYTKMNTLRRMVKNRVPTMAIDEITIIENSSAMYDEMLALRCGLLVLSTDLKSYTLPEECKCQGEGCARCTLTMTINVTGPKTVYAEDIKSKDPKVIPIYEKTPITKLLDGQSLKIEAKARLGYGKQHIKYSPGLLFYKGYPNIKIGNVKNAKAIVESCPRNVFEESNGKVKIKDAEACILCKACSDLDENITVEGAEDDFILTVEPWGQITVKEIMEQAVKAMENDLTELEKEMKKK